VADGQASDGRGGCGARGMAQSTDRMEEHSCVRLGPAGR
jgi:hypothetical protein